MSQEHQLLRQMIEKLNRMERRLSILETQEGAVPLVTTLTEADYTPTITGSVSNPTVTYTYRDFTYQKINTWCRVSGLLQINTISGGSGDVRISLPFAAANRVGAQTPGIVSGGNIEWSSGTTCAFWVTQNTSYGWLVTSRDNASVYVVQISDLAAGDTVNMALDYPTAS